MKNLTKLVVTVFLSMLAWAASAQVKQVFKIVDFETRKPVAGATTTLFGQKLTTDAKGVAVANLPADKKGEFLPMNDWYVSGNEVIIRAPESEYIVYQTADTIKYFMVSHKVWRAVRREMFEKIYELGYDTTTRASSRRLKDSLDKYIAMGSAYVDALVRSTFQSGHYVHDYYQDASSINKYQLLKYNPVTYKEALDLLAAGNVNGAISVARKHISMDDNSAENLGWIELYLSLRDLNAADESEDTYSNYSKILYDNQFTPFSAIDYIRNLNREQLYDRADSVCAVERGKNKNPRHKDRFVPNFIRYMRESDNAKLKASVENLMNIALDNYAKYPIPIMLSDVIWQYRVNYYAYAFMEDSVSATRTVDSAVACVYRYIQNPEYDRFGRNQWLIDYFYDLLDAVASNPDFYPEKSAFRLRDEIYRAAKENYENDPNNLFLQLQLSECAVHWLQNFNDDIIQEADSFCAHVDVLRQLNDVDVQLSVKYPEMFSVQNTQVAVELLSNTLLASDDNAQNQEVFRRYVNSFDLVNTHFPKLFINKYINFNQSVEAYLKVNQLYVLNDELSAFTDRLISLREDNDPKKILVAKAVLANETAESLYHEENYEEAIPYYEQSNEFYKKVLPNDETQWVPFLRNYLQMGDAYLYQNQFDKALMTYQKILDYESQIPVAVMPEYTMMKGNVNYYSGDAYKAMDDMKRAEKEYKEAEKWFKKAISMGDTASYPSLGEMYWGKALVAYKNNNLKKCQQMLVTSVGYYEKCEMDRPLTRYERAKATLGAFYKEYGPEDKYYDNLVGLVKFYRKFMDKDEDYAIGLVQGAEELLNRKTTTKEEKLVYSKDIVNAIIALDYAGKDVELPYLRSLFNLGRNYLLNDSVQEAIDIYRDCASVSEYMYADTAMDMHKANMTDIYQKLAVCYEAMAEDIDTAHKESWYFRAIETRDTLIDLLKELNDDGDVNMTYKTAMQYHNNANLYSELEMIPSAVEYYDKSTDLLMMLYNSEYKSEVEDDVIENYLRKGLLYLDNDDPKAIEYLRKAVSFGERRESNEFSLYYLVSLSQLVEMLEKDKAANADEIAKLNKLLKAEKKKVR